MEILSHIKLEWGGFGFHSTTQMFLFLCFCKFSKWFDMIHSLRLNVSHFSVLMLEICFCINDSIGFFRTHFPSTLIISNNKQTNKTDQQRNLSFSQSFQNLNFYFESI